MLDAARGVVEIARERVLADLETDIELKWAVERGLEIVGEAANAVSDDCRSELAFIEWIQLRGLRNRLVHAYFNINHEIIWEAIRKDLPPLIEQLEKLLEAMRESES